MASFKICSVYNYKNRSKDVFLPDPTTLVGSEPCPKNVCMDRIRSHESLALLGRTALTSSEQSLFKSPIHVNGTIKNQVFLYEVRQMDFRDGETSTPLFWGDLQSYLSLKDPVKPKRFTKRPKGHPKLFNICEAKYADLRGTLLEIGHVSSKWILEYFLDADGVFVSDKPYFESLLQTWDKDPCQDGEAW